MKFGKVETALARGGILAHGEKCGAETFKKGRALTAADITVLQSHGIGHVTVARLEAEDVPEDEAARQVAHAIAGIGTKAQEAFTGRANVHAAGHGLVVLDETRINAINHLHESLTIATLPTHAVVNPKQMIATVKIIPFATPRAVLAQALHIIGSQPLLHVRAFQKTTIHLIITALPLTKPSLITKSETAIVERLKALGLNLSQVTRVPHEQTAVRDALSQSDSADLILIFGASAIVDRGDIIPAALVEAGGVVQHLGMPVDPGNLMMLGQRGAAQVIGIPSCARSPKRNGFDWVLERLVAGLTVLPNDIMNMGVGGLLAEIPTRPQPRERYGTFAPRIAGVILAAGMSSRMGSNKLLAEVNGLPMLHKTAQSYLASGLDTVFVVTGHQADKAQAAISGLNLRVLHNPEYQTGLASSIRVGVDAAIDFDAVVIGLGDMPSVTSHTLDRMLAAFNPIEHRTIVVPTHKGQLGNPVLWGLEHFETLLNLKGDRGARALIAAHRADAVEIEVDDDQVLFDIDTPEALAKLQKESRK
jgi:molybdenum cofactor cytidylyltransferase